MEWSLGSRSVVGGHSIASGEFRMTGSSMTFTSLERLGGWTRTVTKSTWEESLLSAAIPRHKSRDAGSVSSRAGRCREENFESRAHRSFRQNDGSSSDGGESRHNFGSKTFGGRDERHRRGRRLTSRRNAEGASENSCDGMARSVEKGSDWSERRISSDSCDC